MKKNIENEKFIKLEQQYRKMIYSIINKIYVNNYVVVLTKDDLYQEGLIALYDAYRTYNDEYSNSFTTYSYIIIKRRLVRLAIKHNNMAKKEAIAYDSLENLDHYDRLSYYDSCINEDRNKDIDLNNYINQLPEIEKTIAKLYLKRLTYKEIAEKLGIKTKQVDNKLMKIKRLLHEMYNK